MYKPSQDSRPRSLRAFTCFLSLILVTCLAQLGASCASSDERPSERTTNQTERLTADYVTLAASVEEQVTALGAVRTTVETQGILHREDVAVGDVAGAYKGYNSALGDLRASGRRVATSRESMNRSMETYIKDWDKEIAAFQSDDLKRSAQRRRDSTRSRFEDLSAELDKTTQRFDGYVAHLSEIEKALALDLTPAGVGALDGVLRDAMAAGGPVREDALRMVEVLREYAATLSAGGAAQ